MISIYIVPILIFNFIHITKLVYSYNYFIINFIGDSEIEDIFCRLYIYFGKLFIKTT